MLLVERGEIGKRLRKARESVRPVAPKQGWVAQQLGVSQARLSNWEQGKHDPERDYVEKAAALFGLDISFFYSERETAQATLGTPMYPVGFPTVRIPYAGVVPAGDWGDPLDTEDLIEVDVKFEKRGRYATRVVGDSCYPALKQGDLAIWEADTSPAYGLIVLAERKGDHGVTVKELDYDPAAGRPTLAPINDRHDSPPDGDGWTATARLVGVIRNIDGVEQTWYLPTGLRKRHLTL